MINKTIAHHIVTSKLGQGGMGEVYRVTDTKLDRDVAIKILPESFAGDKNRVARPVEFFLQIRNYILICKI